MRNRILFGLLMLFIGFEHWSMAQSPAPLNAGFESGTLSPWSVFLSANASVTKSVAFTGTYSLFESGNSGGVYQDLAGLIPGQIYRVSAQTRSVPGSTSRAQLLLHDTTGQGTSVSALRTPSSSGWETYAASFVPTATTRMRIHLYINGGTGGIYWDDVRVEETGGFEGGSLFPWAPFGCGSVNLTSRVVHSGTYALATDTCAGGVYQDIGGLTQGEIYRVSVSARSDSGTTGRAQLWVHDTAGEGGVGTAARTPSSSGWETLAASFVATSTGSIRIHLFFDGGSGAVYWDDVQIERASGFERGTEISWLFFGCGKARISTALAYEGTRSLAEDSCAGGVYQDLGGLNPGEIYRIRVQARSATGTNGRGRLVVHDTTGQNQAGDGLRLPSSTTWETFAVSFIATATGRMRIHLYFDGGSGTIYWDDVRVERVSGFENGNLDAWLPFGAFPSIQLVNWVPAYKGSFSLSISGSGGVYEDLAGLTPGATYRVSVQVQSWSGTTGRALLWVHDTTGQGGVGDGPRTPSSDVWEPFTTNFVATSTGKLRIHLYFTDYGISYWDEVRIERVGP